jgi:hypothetical protein
MNYASAETKAVTAVEYINEGGKLLGGDSKKKNGGQIQILDLLNEICEVNEDDH